MADIWFISDTHFCHDNILTFKGDDGTLIRQGFKDVAHMNEAMVENWNSVVKDGDHVWHLGDVFMKPKQRSAYLDNLLRSLKGRKRLVAGNHDDLRNPLIQEHFEKIALWRIFKEENFFCCHVPQRKDTFRYCGFQVHGHIHEKVMYDSYHQPDPAYINVCVERTKYTPVHMDEIRKIIADRSRP